MYYFIYYFKYIVIYIIWVHTFGKESKKKKKNSNGLESSKYI